VKSIAEFEEKLDAEHEIGAHLVNFGSQTIHITGVGYWGTDLILFNGTRSDGQPVQLMQHISQVNVMLVAVPNTCSPPRRIGFEMVKRLQKVD
jgi:Family of unknown function (DUF6173)